MKELAKKTKLLEPVDVEKINVVRDHYFPGAYIIDLPLDSVPDHAWQDIFDREWKMSRRLWDRKLFVMGDKLRLVTTPNEMGEKIGWIKQVITETNKGIEEYNKVAPVEKEMRKQLSSVEEKVVIETVRDVLREKLETSFTR